MDSATEFLFGSSADSLASALPYPHTVPPPPGASAQQRPADVFVRAFSEAQLITSKRLWMGNVWFTQEFFEDKTKSVRVSAPPI